jgi:Mce-associated membrane protein
VPAPENRALRLVQGGSGTKLPARSVQRRTERRHPLQPRDPITAVLAHLDEEPALPEVPPEAPDEPDEPAPSRLRARPRPRRRTVRRPEPAALPRRRLVRPSLSTALLAVVLCAALAGAGVFGSRWYDDRTLDRAHQQALAAAERTTVNFVSVSASSVDRDLQRIVDGATGDFQDEFTRGRAQVRAAIVENKVESRGTVLRAGLVSGDRRAAVVLVAIDATVRNTKSPDGRASHYRIQVDVARTGSGRWLVSRLQFVG